MGLSLVRVKQKTKIGICCFSTKRAGRWFSQRTPVSATNKTDRHDIIEILLKVMLNTLSLKKN